MTIFAVSHNQSTNHLRDATFFSTKELAVKHLKKLADDRRYNLEVTVIRDDPDRFEFLLGWEEAHVSFFIIEVNVNS